MSSTRTTMGNVWFYGLWIMGCLAGATACSSQDKTVLPETEDVTEVQFALNWSGLPYCWNSNNGQVFYLWSDGKFYVCHGRSRTWVTTNLHGLSAVTRTTTVAQGSGCETSGSRIEFGLDQNRNGILDEGEVTTRMLVCDGKQGSQGATGATGETGPRGTSGATGETGATGEPGLNSLVRLDTEPAGSNCVAGGVSIQSGLDSNRNGTLEPSEVAQTHYTCNGLNGTALQDGSTPTPDGAATHPTDAGMADADDPNDADSADTEAAPEDGGAMDTGPTPGIVSVSAGGSHSCSVKTDGTVLCWGNNSLGQSSPPAGSFSAVSAGGIHSCGLKSDGTIACWGDNGWGQSTPPAGNFSTVSAGGMHSCGLKSDGTIVCWGNNGWGQSVPPAGTFVAVSIGSRHSCGLATDGSITCWGDNDYAQSSPATGTFTRVSAGSYFTCGLKTDGTMVCWGDNYYGQGTPPAGTFSEASAGGNHTCALKTDGSIACWGYNLFGAASPPAGTYTVVSAGQNHTCAATNGSIACWGYNGDGATTPPGP